MKRFLRCFLLAALTVLSLSTFASAEVIEGQFGYMGGCETKFTLNTSTGVMRVYPDYGFTNVRIGDFAEWESPASNYFQDIKTIIIEEGITAVGENAFYACVFAEEVILPESCSVIRPYAFADCANLREVYIPGGAVEINAFAGCLALRTVTLGKGVTALCRDASLAPDTIENQYNAFAGCGVENFAVEEGNPFFSTVDGVLFTADGRELLAFPGYREGSYTVPDGVEIIQSRAFSSCGYLSEVILPASVRRIGTEAFSGTPYDFRITLNEGLTHIGEMAFADSAIEEIAVPGSVVSMSASIFSNCPNLTKVTFGEGITAIPDWTFDSCKNLTEVVLPSTVSAIGDYAFNLCKNLCAITLPEGLRSLGEHAFESCVSLEKISLPEGITTLPESVFDFCNRLHTVHLPLSLKEICDNAFAYTNLTSVYYAGSTADWNSVLIRPGNDGFSSAKYYFAKEHTPDSVSGTFGQEGDNLTWAFSGETGILTISGTGEMPHTWWGADSAPWKDHVDEIRTLVVEEGVTYLSNFAFQYHTNLTTVFLPRSLETAADWAFFTMGSGIQAAYYAGSEEEWKNVSIGEGGLYHDIACDTEYFKNGFAGTYGAEGDNIRWELNLHTGALTLTGEGEMRDTYDPTSTTPFYAWLEIPWLRHRTEIRSLTMDQRITTISAYAFYHCEQLSEFSLPQNLTKIGELAFYQTGLTAITIPGTMKTVEPGTFRECIALRDVTVCAGVESIADEAFLNATGLTNLTIAGSVKTIGESAFYGCSYLENLVMEEGVRTLGESAFFNCKYIKTIHFPRSITTVGKQAFSPLIHYLYQPNTQVYYGGSEDDINRIAGLEYLCWLFDPLVDVHLNQSPAVTVAAVRVTAPAGSEVTFDTQTVTSDGENCAFPAEMGTYTLTVKKDGCLTYTVKNITVDSADIDLGSIELLQGDTNGDDMINIMDMAAFRQNFGKTGAAVTNPYTDTNGDGMVNIMDMGTFRKNFGKTAAKDCTVEYSA